MKPVDSAAFDALASGRAAALRRAAFGLTGDWHLAEDLVQTALTKLYAHWPLTDVAAADRWLTRTMVTSWIDETRRPWWRREAPTDTLPERPAPDLDDSSVSADLLAILDRLPPRMRACIVLRYLADYSQEQTADLLGCSVGTVKTQTSRGLTRIRSHLPPTAMNSTVPSTTTITESGHS